MGAASRRDFLKTLAAGAAFAAGCNRSKSEQRNEPTVTNPKEKTADPGDGKRMPVVFVGHGSPMNAIEDNRFSRGFAELAELVPRPKAILSISAHWYVAGTFLTGEAAPRTIHDFSGFPKSLYEIEHPEPGDPELAGTARSLLGTGRASLRTDWGLDHGTWSVLRRMFPGADVPVVKLSIDRRLPLIYAYAATDEADDVRFPTTGFDLGSISMRNVVFGQRTGGSP